MNGKPVWCRPAPTRDSGIWDPVDEPLETVTLDELPALIASAIKAGLVYRPDPAPLVAIGQRKRRYAVGICDRCQGRFNRGHKSGLTTCVPCRRPAKICKACGKSFQPQKAEQVCCNKKCAGLALRQQAEERHGRKPTLSCVICGAQHRYRFSGGKLSQTCGKTCGYELQKIRNAEKKAKKHTS